MRILSARISNYRVHCRDEPLEVRFDPSLHVIHGPNEAGKSTLIEAIAAALFERCKVSGGLVDAMRPYHGGGYPEVEVVFEEGEAQYRVSKRFRGQNGTCELRIENGGRVLERLESDAAEARLQEILGLPPVTRGERKPESKAHFRLLWVEQGRSATRPDGE
ncbi:MAG TPA: AAA family ATPase, partial [Planctomycetota bacterium]|nr:AAA family ATPase [Planctomycetota bacterium]